MIKIIALKKIFSLGTLNEHTALDNISLNVQEGDFITIIGSNGAGKSTLLNTIAGTTKPTSGKILLDEQDITKLAEYKRARFIGRIHQNPLMGTSGDMSIEQNMALCGRKGFRYLTRTLNDISRELYRQSLAELNMGLENRLQDRVSLLSGGQRQALTLLTTVMSNPRLLLLDEHTAALDPGNAEVIMALTEQLVREQNKTTIMVTHNMQQAISYGNRLIMMDKGRIVLDISGQEKASLTVTQLVDRFRAMHSTLAENDEVVLNKLAS
ncbi:ATP-binding cassette domain-containing protein [Deferribacterales bacterium RsTz2092]|nr:ABC transporter ATP-binding protein [Deferribacterales bacterium]